jgi:hypothetical protein
MEKHPDPIGQAVHDALICLDRILETVSGRLDSARQTYVDLQCQRVRRAVRAIGGAV